LTVSPSRQTDQSAVAAWLETPAAFGAASGKVRRIETHISNIFLHGERALKMKRAVTFPYLDFASLKQRETACRAEVRINRRTAPDIYKGVVAVVLGEDGVFHLDEDGEPVEWLVDMTRFDEAGLFDRLVQDSQLHRIQMDDLADQIAAFHAGANVCPTSGGADGTAEIVTNNAACLKSVTGDILASDKVDALIEAADKMLNVLRRPLNARQAAGAVRHCHGDLHLRNICMIDDHPVLFDGIEFSSMFSEIDVLYDLAFLLMDLIFRGHRRLACMAFNRYLDVTGDVVSNPGGLAVLPLFLSMRATVRAHVDGAQSVSLGDAGLRDERLADARRYLDLAGEFLSPQHSRLIAVGGLSGSGKSRMAREVAPYCGLAPGARVVRTDAVRKRIAGVAQESRLGDDGYSAEMHQQTYDAFYAEIEIALEQGHSVIADAVFPGSGQRAQIEAIAERAGMPFQGLWIEAPVQVLENRVRDRRRDISDATIEIVRQQSDYDLGDITWARIDGSGTRDETLNLGKREIGIGD